MYPKTILFLMSNGENLVIAQKNNVNYVRNEEAIDDNKTKIVFMFDDGWKSVYEAYKIMEKYNFKGSIQVIPSLIDEEGYMNYELLSEVYLQGWDLLNHSYSHKENMYDDCDRLLSDFNEARKWMVNRYLGKNSDMIVMPYGEINPFLINEFLDAGYCNIRTSDNIIILGNKIEYYPVATINVLTEMSANEVIDTLMDENNPQKKILLIFHKIGEEKDIYGMTYSKDKFEKIVEFIYEHSDEFQVITYSTLFN